MSCFTGCFAKNLPPRDVHNRTTNAPIRFNQNELEELRKKFLKVSVGTRIITRESFKKNMGILGLHCAQEFSQRMFNAFDLDNDGEINFQDFIEYMEILKCGSDANKARISFKMIAKSQIGIKQRSKISQVDFMEFLNDFFNSWSSITNISITPQIRERTNQYVSFLFKKVKKQTGKDEIDIRYYIQKLYKDKDYMQSFEFITQGMADIFINDRDVNDTNPEAILYRVLKEVKTIKQTIFQMSNQSSYFYQPVRVEEIPRQLPHFNTFFQKSKKKQNSNRQSPLQSSTKSQGRNGFLQNAYGLNNTGFQQSQTHDNTKTPYNYLRESRKLQLKEIYENKLIISLQKKLKFIQQKIDGIVESTKNIFTTLTDKFENKRQQMRKGKTETAKNVHKRINRQGQQMIFLGDDNWNLVLNMMIGIQMAVRSVRGFQEMIYEQPKDFGLKYYFELVPRRFGDQQYTSTIYSFTDYAPNTFNHIRKLFKIDNQDYIGSIGPNRLMASLMMGEVSSMTSLTSQGKSGSFFYYTADSKYMLKTISYRQYKFLRNILKDYYYYLKQNPQTMITKFFGLHKLIQKNDSGDQICRSYFVIMANVFNTKEKIIERYDIKGSTYGRDNLDKDPSSTKKDNDFKKRDPIYLQEEQRRKILKIIRSDAAFFEAHDIIDYSLLIGVIKRSDRSSETSDIRNAQSRLLKEQDEFQPQNRESKIFLPLQQENSQSYIFGIIDILTPYDSKKVFEYYFKRLVYGEGISAVPPSDYAKRFVSFIQSSVFPKSLME